MAPMVVPLRAALDAIPLWQILVSPVLAIVAIYFLFVVGGRVYSGAILQGGAHAHAPARRRPLTRASAASKAPFQLARTI